MLVLTTQNNFSNISEFPRYNFIHKAVCSLKGKCQYECIVFKVEVYNYEPNNDNINV